MGTTAKALKATFTGYQQSWEDVTALIAKGMGVVSIALALWAKYGSDTDALFWLWWAYGIAAVSIAALVFELFRTNLKLEELKEQISKAVDPLAVARENAELIQIGRRILIGFRAEDADEKSVTASIQLFDKWDRDTSNFISEYYPHELDTIPSQRIYGENSGEREMVLRETERSLTLLKRLYAESSPRKASSALIEDDLIELADTVSLGELLLRHLARKYKSDSTITDEHDREECRQWFMRAGMLAERVLGEAKLRTLLLRTGITVGEYGKGDVSDPRPGIEIMTKRLYQEIENHNRSSGAKRIP